MPLTDLACRNAKPSDKPRKMADGSGMYLLVNKSGKYWRWDYRFAGKRFTMAFGVYPEVSLVQARERLQRERKTLSSGVNPMVQKKLSKQAADSDAVNTFEALTKEWLAHQAGRWEAVTLQRTRASLEADVYPVIGALPATSVTPRVVMDLVKGIEKRGASEVAMRVLQRIKSVYRYGVTHMRVDSNPMVDLVPSDILRPRRVQHRPALSKPELPNFVRQLNDYSGDPHTVNGLRLLLLTATRPGEVRGARWSEFDLESRQWRIPAERMKMRSEHVVPLSTQAVEVIEAMRPLSGTRELVFPSPFYPSKPLSENTFNSALARMGYKNCATAHGFRALFSTMANEQGWPPDVIERQLAHVERNQARAAYNRSTYLKQRSEMMQWWANLVFKE
ncbi:tyrosine-type recombinase/integrase [uncultured Pseudacidovorax sp.]|uniref:tyrosine-type recombinase/integrase n=1 Tax=uncultured Pseudacidovorax sp. TaxID=679313 RepID=UPI0025E7BD52|nr:tyrosine-type recombinase/integrase [uncultured Pseudacidovorax sp.]